MSALSVRPEGPPRGGGKAPAASEEDDDLAIRIERLGLSPPGGKKLLILDLNGLLVHTIFQSRGDITSVPSSREPDFIVGRKYVFKRPFCDEFLRFCFASFHVAVWSSATRCVRAVCSSDAKHRGTADSLPRWEFNGILCSRRNVLGTIECVLGALVDRLLFIWDQSKCTDTGFKTLENENKPLFMKELGKLWDERRSFSPKNTLLVDDTPYKALLNPPNTAIFPKPYEASHTEDTDLSKFLLPSVTSVLIHTTTLLMTTLVVIDVGPGGEIRNFLEGLAAADAEVPSYVASHSLGQEPITTAHRDWNFYSRVVTRWNRTSTPTTGRATDAP
ncbi:unnamed protein product [Spirodela intermedia]|uniref:Mitochondrial import inner membrane translocase subunit TIM50 n=2 Tax=Spirodela intermedia TaxID=51605 RepID=A0A7I8L6Z3_SPIIN|nr:unnamed protein product [Spirodela intermedia]CAA6668532.1 unnamed protein product [Spirodela intermedia]CAA7405416.1 unnamed protein product [Spirodela intermedia]